jgi:hypothetical protein
VKLYISLGVKCPKKMHLFNIFKKQRQKQKRKKKRKKEKKIALVKTIENGTLQRFANRRTRQYFARSFTDPP